MKITDLSHLPRVALVIGVQDYDPRHIPELGAVHDDVDAIVALLKEKGGFKVTPCFNPDRVTLLKFLYDFGEVVKKHSKGCVAVLYYSGHGLLDQEAHYMLPKDWEETTNISLSLRSYACKWEEDALSTVASATAAVAFFDACRSLAAHGGVRGPSQAARQRGLNDPFQVVGTADNLLVCYACSARATAEEGIRNGRFTAAILKCLCDGRTVNEAVSDIYDMVVEETSRAQRPEFLYRRPALFDKLRLGLPKVSGVQGVCDAMLQAADPRAERALDNLASLSPDLATLGASGTGIPHLVRLLGSHDKHVQV